jgi:squalene-hopene/tetraprenyl-beta-curcumene cyclase
MRQLLEPITQACDHLRLQQNPEGFWVYDLEADATIPAESILIQRFLERQVDSGLKEGLARYLRRRQLQDGGWPLFEGGSADISATVKSYFALKIMGDSQDAQHMVKARLTA